MSVTNTVFPVSLKTTYRMSWNRLLPDSSVDNICNKVVYVQRNGHAGYVQSTIILVCDTQASVVQLYLPSNIHLTVKRSYCEVLLPHLSLVFYII